MHELQDQAVDLARSMITKARTVLIVEFDDPLRTVAAGALRKKGYRVLEAQNDDTSLALVCAQDNHIDLLICPAAIPGMDGVKFIQSVRNIENQIRVIVTYFTAEAAGRYRSQSNIHFLHKPFSSTQLVSMVDAVIGTDVVASVAQPV